MECTTAVYQPQAINLGSECLYYPSLADNAVTMFFLRAKSCNKDFVKKSYFTAKVGYVLGMCIALADQP